MTCTGARLASLFPMDSQLFVPRDAGPLSDESRARR